MYESYKQMRIFALNFELRANSDGKRDMVIPRLTFA